MKMPEWAKETARALLRAVARRRDPLRQPPEDPVLRKIWDNYLRRGIDPWPLADWPKLEKAWKKIKEVQDERKT